MATRLEVDSIGESYEVFAESVLGRLATLTRIGTKQDFGTDKYCQPRVKVGGRMETVTELCLLQVKGGSSRLKYGGLEKRKWKHQDFAWLKDLWAPLYLAHVDDEYHRVDLFSLWPIWWVLWKCGTPFKIEFSREEPTGTAHTFRPPTERREESGAKHGDGNIWTIDLGPSLLRLTHQELNNDDFRDKAVEIFRYWIQRDRQTVARFHARIPLIEAVASWKTNELPGAYQKVLVWDPRPGMNIDWLARAFVPPLHTLGVHLQWQDNCDAYRLIPILEWVQANHFGDGMIQGLLDGLVATQQRGVGPAPAESPSYGRGELPTQRTEAGTKGSPARHCRSRANRCQLSHRLNRSRIAPETRTDARR